MLDGEAAKFRITAELLGMKVETKYAHGDTTVRLEGIENAPTHTSFNVASGELVYRAAQSWRPRYNTPRFVSNHRLRELLVKATPGEWFAVDSCGCGSIGGTMREPGEGVFTVSSVQGKDGWETQDYFGISQANAEHIAATHNELGRLLDDAERDHAAIESMSTELQVLRKRDKAARVTDFNGSERSLLLESLELFYAEQLSLAKREPKGEKRDAFLAKGRDAQALALALEKLWIAREEL